MDNVKKCPCDTVIELQKTTKEQEKRLNDGNVQFAIIATKLNIMLAILGVIGTAVIGVVVKMIIA